MIKYKVCTAVEDIQRDSFQQDPLQMCKHTVVSCGQREYSLPLVSWLFLSDGFGCKGNVVSNVIWQIYATIQEF